MSALYRKALKPPAPRSRFTEFQAEVGLARLKTVDGRVGRRREQADMIRSLLAEEVRPQRIIEGACSSCYFFVALLPGRAQEIRMSLLKRGIDAGVAAEIADDCSGLLGQENCPNAKTVFQRAIQLPLHEGMSDSDIRYVAETLNGEVRVRNEGIAR
jgi:aminotransferase